MEKGEAIVVPHCVTTEQLSCAALGQRSLSLRHLFTAGSESKSRLTTEMFKSDFLDIYIWGNIFSRAVTFKKLNISGVIVIPRFWKNSGDLENCQADEHDKPSKIN